MVDFRYQGAPPPVGDSGDVTSVTAGDATVTIGGTGANPTVKVTPGQFDAAGAAATAQTAAQAYADTGDAARILKSTRQLKTANYTAVIGDLVAADTTGGTFTVTIPAASGGKGRVVVKWVAGAVAPTIALSGSDHFNTTSGATSATPVLLNQGYQFESDGVSVWTVTADDLPLSQLDLRYAGMASPALTGTPTAPTASPGTNTTQLATTAYADAIAALKANIASPTFTGTPAAPTASALDNSTKLATTAYADAADAVEKARALAAEALLASSGLPGESVPTQAGWTPLSSNPRSLTAARIQLIRYRPYKARTFTLVAFATEVAASVNDPFEIGIYTAGTTLTRVATTGSTSGVLNSTGAKTIALSYTVDPSVTYYIALTAATIGGTAASVTGCLLANGFDWLLYGNTQPLAGAGRIDGALSGGLLPSTITASGVTWGDSGTIAAVILRES